MKTTNSSPPKRIGISVFPAACQYRLGNTAQYHIAVAVPVRIVDFLEMVDVEDHRRQVGDFTVIVAPEERGDRVLSYRVVCRVRSADRGSHFRTFRGTMPLAFHRFLARMSRLCHFSFGVDDRRAVLEDEKQLLDRLLEDDRLIGDLEPSPLPGDRFWGVVVDESGKNAQPGPS